MIKQAYEAGVKQAMIDAGLIKEGAAGRGALIGGLAGGGLGILSGDSAGEAALKGLIGAGAGAGVGALAGKSIGKAMEGVHRQRLHQMLKAEQPLIADHMLKTELGRNAPGRVEKMLGRHLKETYHGA